MDTEHLSRQENKEEALGTGGGYFISSGGRVETAVSDTAVDLVSLRGRGTAMSFLLLFSFSPRHSPIPSRGNYLWLSGIIISLVFLIIFTTCVCILKDYNLVLPISAHSYHSCILVFYTIRWIYFICRFCYLWTFKLFSIFATTNNAAVNILDHVSRFLGAVVSLWHTLDNKNSVTQNALPHFN